MKRDNLYIIMTLHCIRNAPPGNVSLRKLSLHIFSDISMPN